MPLQYPDGRPFTVGAAPFLLEPVSQKDRNVRIMLSVEFENQPTMAILDTGSPFAICSTDIAGLIGIDLKLADARTKLIIRGQVRDGGLHHMSLRFLAKSGDSVELPVVVFVPDPDPDDEPLPSFIGINQCLERIRFAIDPQHRWFYFDEPFVEPLGR